MSTITEFVLTNNLIDAKKLFESRIGEISANYLDAKKLELVAETFNGKPFDLHRYLKPRMTKNSLQEALASLNNATTSGHKFHTTLTQHGFDLDRRDGKHHEYVNYSGHEVHVDHPNSTWKHYSRVGHEIDRGSGHDTLDQHLMGQNLHEAFGRPAEAGFFHPLHAIAKEFGFKQHGPKQTKSGISTQKFTHENGGVLKVKFHHDLPDSPASWEHQFGTSRQVGAGQIQLKNRLKTFHVAKGGIMRPAGSKLRESVELNEEFGDVHPELTNVHSTIQKAGYKHAPKKLTGRSDALEDHTKHVFIHPKTKDEFHVTHVVDKKKHSPNNPAAHSVYVRHQNSYGESLSHHFHGSAATLDKVSDLHSKLEKHFRTKG